MEYWSFIPHAVNTLIIAILFVFLGLIIGKLIEKFLFLIIQELELTMLIHKATDVRVSFEKVIPPFVRISIILIGIIKAFMVLGIEKIIFIAFLTIGLLLVTGIVIFSLYNTFLNTIAGLSIKRNLKKLQGKELAFDTLIGKIERSSLTHTFLVSKEEDHYAIPHSSLKQKCMTLL